MDTYSGGDGIPLVVNETKNVISGESYKKAQVIIQLTVKREKERKGRAYTSKSRFA